MAIAERRLLNNAMRKDKEYVSSYLEKEVSEIRKGT